MNYSFTFLLFNLLSIYRIFSFVPNPPLKKLKTKLNDEPTLRGAEWAKIRGLVPGYGGLWPGNPDAKKYSVTIKSLNTGEEWKADVPNDRYIFNYLEEIGVDVPIINKHRMCRQGV